jgi:hypothetical protein
VGARSPSRRRLLGLHRRERLSQGLTDVVRGCRTKFASVRRTISTSGVVARIVLVMAAFALIAAVPSGASPSPTSTLRCGSDALTVVWRGTTGGLAGTYGDLFWIRNDGAFSCVVSGFPTISFYRNGARVEVKSEDTIGHRGNDEMGVVKLRRPPTVRISPGATASFWLFGSDVQTPCANASQVVVSLRSLSGWASIPVPRGFSSWTYCGGVVLVDPIVPGGSGSDPARPLRTEIQ